jgi:lipopolysaccharide/colanic/teichoic acid biosynthesis glycosyltransferase
VISEFLTRDWVVLPKRDYGFKTGVSGGIICLLLLADAVLINLGFLASFWLRYGMPFPEYNFKPFRASYVFLTVINIAAISFFNVYKSRFKTSWELFQKIFTGLAIGTLLSMAFVYTFRGKWMGFPTSVFIISFFVNLFLIFKFNQFVLKAKRKIRKKVIVIGEDDLDGIVAKKTLVERKKINQISDLIEYKDIDEVIICEKIHSEKDLNLLIYLVQKLKVDVVFSPSCYMGLLFDRINGSNSLEILHTFIGRRRDIDEFLMRSFDIIGSVAILIVSAPVLIFVTLLVKITCGSPVLYKQKRVGKDGTIFTLYKFRTMINNAEEKIGPVWASPDDPRVTRIGKILRMTRLDEFPQLFNVLAGHMSLVGPRPERPHFVRMHKPLRELRLAIRPGLTGLAQIRSFYDLKPQHKIKYDYLYIQRRSFLVNLYILAKTVPVLFSKKGW